MSYFSIIGRQDVIFQAETLIEYKDLPYRKENGLTSGGYLLAFSSEKGDWYDIAKSNKFDYLGCFKTLEEAKEYAQKIENEKS